MSSDIAFLGLVEVGKLMDRWERLHESDSDAREQFFHDLVFVDHLAVWWRDEQVEKWCVARIEDGMTEGYVLPVFLPSDMDKGTFTESPVEFSM